MLVQNPFEDVWKIETVSGETGSQRYGNSHLNGDE